MNKIIERFSSETGKNEKFEYIEIEEQTIFMTLVLCLKDYILRLQPFLLFNRSFSIFVSKHGCNRIL